MGMEATKWIQSSKQHLSRADNKNKRWWMGEGHQLGPFSLLHIWIQHPHISWVTWACSVGCWDMSSSNSSVATARPIYSSRFSMDRALWKEIPAFGMRTPSLKPLKRFWGRMRWPKLAYTTLTPSYWGKGNSVSPPAPSNKCVPPSHGPSS